LLVDIKLDQLRKSEVGSQKSAIELPTSDLRPLTSNQQ